MKVILSFDYELFFGDASGTPEKCMIEPAMALAEVAARYQAPLCFFVDAGYLCALERLSGTHGELCPQHDQMRRNLDFLAERGHEVLLHVHPHWEDAVWTNGQWQFDLSRFSLSRFNGAAVIDIVTRYTEALRPYSPQGHICAYRAGGWAVQPFPQIGAALIQAGIRIDSSVFPGGRDATGKGNFDFSRAPKKAHWQFETDPAVEVRDGAFLEIPASSMTVSPTYYWRLALARTKHDADTRHFGDGAVRPMSAARNWSDKFNKLLSTTIYCVTLDGMKAGLATEAYQRARQRGDELLVLLSHPKMISPYSLNCMDTLLHEVHRHGDTVVGYGAFSKFN
jgi:hypothetical protein